MASMGIRCGGNGLLECGFLRGNRNLEKRCDGVSSVKMKASCDQKFDSLGWKPRMMEVPVNSAVTKAAPSMSAVVVKKEETKKEAVVYEKMDEWLRDSVVEIVQNLKKAPLLVHVYSEEEKAGDETTTTKLKTEEAREEEDWVAVMERWRKEEERVPEGVIFVEKIEEGDNVEGGGYEPVEEDLTKAWGIVVQGRGKDCAPTCYLLKTTGVDGGLGLRCTHFCLMKVKSLRETARSQLKNSWLVGGY